MKFKISPSDATCGAIVTGVRIASLDDETWPVIWEAFLEYGVLIFPQQHPTVAQQSAFAERFGEIEYLDGKGKSKVVPIGGDSAIYKDEGTAKAAQGIDQWHIDGSYMPLASKASVLSAIVIPSSGGGTEWADMRAAYDSLDEETRERIADLSAYHSFFYSQDQIGNKMEVGAAYGFYAGEKPLRPLVKTHPDTGRRSLYICRHAHGIPGLSEAESSRLLAELEDFACRPPRVFSYAWRMGDMAVWDNRRLTHRRMPYDTTKQRLLYHARVAGDPATELAAGMTPQ